MGILVIGSGCSSSKSSRDESEKQTNDEEEYEGLSNGDLILKFAEEERNNQMYSPDADTTFLYWLNFKPVKLKKTTKCNIFALNTLFRAGFKTPEINALSRDLFDESLFQDILPVIKLESLEDIIKGDLVIWKYHVIIFEKLVYLDNKPFARGFWAGTKQKEDGYKVKNNTIHGNYPLNGDFIVRRPVKK